MARVTTQANQGKTKKMPPKILAKIKNTKAEPKNTKVNSKTKDEVIELKLKSTAKNKQNTKTNNAKTSVKTATKEKLADSKAVKVNVSKEKQVTKVTKGRIITAQKNVSSKPGTQFGKDLSVRKASKDKLQTLVDRTSEIPAHLITPTPEMLKPFKDAALRNNAKRVQVKDKNNKPFIAKPSRSGKKVEFDLRIHSPMSEGYFSTGGIDPAGAMVRLASAKGLDMIAVTDYNSAEFVDLIKEKAKNTSVTVLPGVDLRCRVGACDEVFFIALFPENKGSDYIYSMLEKLNVPLAARGRRSYVIPKDVKEVVSVVEAAGGVLIPSRPDKTPLRLGAVKTLVEDLGFRTFDLVHPENPEYFKERWPHGEFTFFSFSNANALGQIGSRAIGFKLPANGFNGIRSICERKKNKQTAL